MFWAYAYIGIQRRVFMALPTSQQSRTFTQIDTSFCGNTSYCTWRGGPLYQYCPLLEKINTIGFLCVLLVSWGLVIYYISACTDHTKSRYFWHSHPKPSFRDQLQTHIPHHNTHMSCLSTSGPWMYEIPHCSFYNIRST